MGRSDRQRLQDALRPIMAGIVGAFGRQCEVVLHDLSRPERSIVWIEGNVTGRRVGGGITDLGLAKLRLGDPQQDLIGYVTQTKDGKVLRSSSVFLRDDAGNVTGALCINLDITPFLGLRQHVQDLLTPVTRDIEESFLDRPADVLGELIHEGLRAVGSPPPRMMGKQQRVKLVELLDRRGAFIFRSAVPTVSRVLGISRYTLYNYLKQIRAAMGAGAGKTAPRTSRRGDA